MVLSEAQHLSHQRKSADFGTHRPVSSRDNFYTQETFEPEIQSRSDESGKEEPIVTLQHTHTFEGTLDQRKQVDDCEEECDRHSSISPSDVYTGSLPVSNLITLGRESISQLFKGEKSSNQSIIKKESSSFSLLRDQP